jgi:ribosomal protein S27E
VASDEKHSIRNGIVIAVVSAAVLYGATFIPGLARGVAHVALSVGRFLADIIALPRWLFIIICIFALVAVYRLVRPFFARAPRGASVKDYLMDRFFGVVWRWRYGFSGSPQDIWCFCPRCDTQLVYTEDRFPDRVWFTCENCDERLCESEGSKEYVLSKVFRQIDRKIRNGEWKHGVARNA